MASDTTAGVRTGAWRLRLPGPRLAPWAVSWLQVGPLALTLLVLFALPTLLVAGMMRVVDVRRELVG